MFHAKWDKTTNYYFTLRSSREVRDFDKKNLPRDPLGKVFFCQNHRTSLELPCKVLIICYYLFNKGGGVMN